MDNARPFAGRTLLSESESRTIEIGRCVGKRLEPGDVVLLIGELGAGKTRFVQGIVEGIGLDEPARSPTFVLVSEYEGRVRLLHSDLYRLASTAEVDDLGLLESVEEGAALAVEWADRARAAFPSDALMVTIEAPAAAEARRITLEAGGDRSARLLRGLLDEVSRG
ncbi:MAG: tRNA (adenosine(37)-N6)-threonylcarbamoyltransferase complex ATPase subunit type 1 TsaE [SAR202 cluster bacterium]|nr:tRNA (adenosine(37)-N6)-threonylcarbamoyltransferase complex ATPase subunit type 1 TsaE [SAR202 cluster bacterium]